MDDISPSEVSSARTRGSSGGSSAAADPTLFRSFWMAGFGGIGASRHSELAESARADYRRARYFGMHTVRESIDWRRTEQHGRFDFNQVATLCTAAEREGIQIVWTLVSNGFPPDVDPHDSRFVGRFARFAESAARELRRCCAGVPIIAPMESIGAIARRYQDVDDTSARLAQATLKAVEAIRDIDSRARFIFNEDAAGPSADTAFRVWDLLCANADVLDLLGITLRGSKSDTLWRDLQHDVLATLAEQIHARYRRPLLINSGSHDGERLAQWLGQITGGAARAMARGVPIAGITLDHLISHAHGGLWQSSAEDPAQRRLDRAYAQALKSCQRDLEAQQGALRAPVRKARRMRALLVFSHLRWDSLRDRTQHLMARLARRYRVLFFEEPVRASPPPYLQRFAPLHNVEVLRPHTPVDGAHGFAGPQIAHLQPLLAQYIREFRLTDFDAWLTTPMALPLLADLKPRLLVYDCGDDLAALDGAPRQLAAHENALLKRADLVLTSGPGLYATKRGAKTNVHNVPNAVDTEHFRPPLQPGVDPQASLPHPRLGFHGVIDERLDLELIAQLADLRPNWQFVMLGPVVGLRPEQLPRRPNLHWVGQQDYEALPAWVGGWEVGVLPLRLTRATHLFSGRQMLDCLAAEKPVVATRVPDIDRLLGDSLVATASSAAAFAAACDRALAENPRRRASRIAHARQLLLRNSWDRAAGRVVELLDATATNAVSAPRESKPVRAPPVALPAPFAPVSLVPGGAHIAPMAAHDPSAGKPSAA